MVRKPASFSSATSRTSSNCPPSVLSAGWETDDEDWKSMDSEDYLPPKSLSVSIPKANSIHGPYCPRRPTLREILANTADPPWTLAAFMAYLSNNHCLETLEFTMDAGRYKKHYAKMMSKASSGGLPPAKDREYVQALWERLVAAYIQPSGSREVNIPSHVRDPILRLRPGPDKVPASPEKLDPAVAMVYELMEESVLVPFLNSVYPQTAHASISSCPPDPSDHENPAVTRTLGDRSHHVSRIRPSRNSPPPHTAVEPYSHSYTPPSMLDRRPIPSPSQGTTKGRATSKLTQSTSTPAALSSRDIDSGAHALDAGASGSGSGFGMTDDSGSTGSPANDSPINDSPTTPPTTPPMSDAHNLYAKRDSGMWKRLGRLSGMQATKKKRDGGLREEQ